MNLPFPVAASVRHSPVLTPHFAVLILSLSLSAVVADERYRAAKHTAQGASSNDGGGSSTANYYYFIRRNRVRSNGLPLPRSTHRPDIRFFAAPGPPADGMSPGRAACPRIAVRVPRCVVLTSKAVPGLISSVAVFGQVCLPQSCGSRLALACVCLTVAFAVNAVANRLRMGFVADRSSFTPSTSLRTCCMNLS